MAGQTETETKSPVIRFYFKKGRWHVKTIGVAAVPANEWWKAINSVKCMNHKLRQQQRKD